jgi:hypothetical protein
VYVSYIPIHFTCTGYIIFHDLIALMIFGMQYKLRSFSCIFLLSCYILLRRFRYSPRQFILRHFSQCEIPRFCGGENEDCGLPYEMLCRVLW